MKVLVAGGAGYIGTHVCVELLNAGYEAVVVDNLINSSYTALERVEQITGKKVAFYQGDCLDEHFLRGVFEKEGAVGSQTGDLFSEKKSGIDAVINFAGLKAVGESVEKPLHYYNNNIVGTLNLLRVMDEFEVKNIIFSSSATVYGDTEILPIAESAEVGAVTNPYGQTKLMLEQILTDLYRSDSQWNIMLLRYFNPIGAHESGLIGEDPAGVPNNLMPYIAQVAVGQRECVNVFGNDYDTPDGTGVRDYIHVTDLARGHVAALEKLMPDSGLNIYNLGTGKGYSVLEVIAAYGRACGREIPYVVKERRAGDIASSYCDAGKAQRELGWQAEKTLDDMCADSWRWQSGNPNGYRK